MSSNGLSSGFPDAVVIAEPDTGKIVDTNPAAAEFFGYPREELRSMEILDLHPPDDRQRYRTLFEKHFENQPAVISRFEDGSPVYGHTAGGQRIPVEINAWALRDEEHDRDPPLFQGVFRDVSERLAYERRLTEQRDGLEVLTQILSHDIRNDLQMVTGYADVLDDYVDEDGAEYLQALQTSTRDAIELTRTARTMAEAMLSPEENGHPVSLRDTLGGELEDVRSEYPDAVITVEGTVPASTVDADGMLDSVFRNLLTNAIQHNDKEVPGVHVDLTEDSESVTIRIADNGPGIPDEQTETVFGKGERGLESAGTGIGLYLVKTLTNGYDGDVWVEQNEPEGTVFAVELPLVDGE